METWYNQATPEDKHKVSKPRIPESILEGLQPSQKRDLWRQAAEHQYAIMLGVTALRSTLPMVPKDLTWTENT